MSESTTPKSRIEEAFATTAIKSAERLNGVAMDFQIYVDLLQSKPARRRRALRILAQICERLDKINSRLMTRVKQYKAAAE